MSEKPAPDGTCTTLKTRTPRPSRSRAGHDVDSHLYTKGDIARKARVTERTVSRWIANGKLEAIHLGGPNGPVRVAGDAFVKFLNNGLNI